MDENGNVIDLELAKAILIEFFSTNMYWWERRENQKFLEKIKTELIYNDDYFTFKDSEGYTYFGGPEGASEYWIQEVYEWVRERKLSKCWSIDGLVTDLNNEDKVFYEIDGEIKCFIIHEGD